MDILRPTELSPKPVESHLGFVKKLRYGAAGFLTGASLLLPSLAHAQETNTYLRLLTPTGGQTLKVGDPTVIAWEKSSNVSDCIIGYSLRPPGDYPEGGSLSPIDTAYTGTGSGPEPRTGSYLWNVGVGPMDDSNQKQIRIVLSCTVTGNHNPVTTQSDDFLTVIQ